MNQRAPAISNLIDALAADREPTNDETRAALVEGLMMITDFLDDVRRIAAAIEESTREVVSGSPMTMQITGHIRFDSEVYPPKPAD